MKNWDFGRPTQWFRGTSIGTPQIPDDPRKLGHLETLLITPCPPKQQTPQIRSVVDSLVQHRWSELTSLSQRQATSIDIVHNGRK